MILKSQEKNQIDKENRFLGTFFSMDFGRLYPGQAWMWKCHETAMKLPWKCHESDMNLT